MNELFPVNVYQVAFCHVIVSVNQLIDATTFPFVRVHDAGKYVIVQVGTTVSIHVIIAESEYVILFDVSVA
jgi:hypothetical protein